MKLLSGGTLTWAKSTRPVGVTLATAMLLLSWLKTRYLPSAE
jgi:hypothetical protein